MLLFNPDGTFTGTCSSGLDPGDLGLYGTWSGGATIEGKITGTVTKDGKFTFKEELTERYKPDDPSWWKFRTVVFEGEGAFTSATEAKGTAKFTAECKAATEVASHCGLDSKYDHFTGTVPWVFTYSTGN
ncbi:MAG: hypothetical protein AB9891_05655 [Anaerolineaceae bacterium]